MHRKSAPVEPALEYPTLNPADFLDHAPHSLGHLLNAIHQELQAKPSLRAVQRISAAVYDASNDIITTFLESNIGLEPIGHYETHLSKMGSLHRLSQTRLVRIIDNIHPNGPGRISDLYRNGLRSSMTTPIYRREQLLGFIFFDATKSNFFNKRSLAQLAPYVTIIALLLVHKIMTARLVRAIATMGLEVSRVRDDETGSHLDRMSNYARLIAIEGAKLWNLSDEFIEYLFWYAPLHDIGKAAIPDTILFKPGKLTKVEWSKMKLHVTKGVEIIDSLIKQFGQDAISNIGIARNIIAYHHENIDGSGYPNGINGNQIPIESRIAAVADVFDALTSDRPYKRKWSNKEAIEYMRSLVDKKFDGDCVEYLARKMEEVVDIQNKFQEYTKK